MKKLSLSSWEAYCVLFFLCIHRLTGGFVVRLFANGADSTLLWAFLAAAATFLLIFLICTLAPLRKFFQSPLWVGVSILYWLISAMYFLRNNVYLLQQTFYPQSPFWFLSAFLLLGALIPVLLRKRTCLRLFSLLTPPVCAAFFLLLLFALFKGDASRLFLPQSGGISFSFLLLFADIFFLLPVLLSRDDHKKSPARLGPLAFGLFSALAALFVFSLLGPVCTQGTFPLYAFSKSDPMLLGVYLMLFLPIAFLHLMLSLYLVVKFFLSLSPDALKKVTPALLCLSLCLCLSGCYDSREVEEGAYILSLGTDKGTAAPYLYTFQLANPAKSSGEEKDSGTATFTAEAESLSLAMVKLRSYIGKEPDLSHLKAAFFSKDAAKEGLSAHTEYLLSQTDASAAAYLCLCDNANQYLSETEPTLEKNTAKFYDLLFQSHNSPFAPIATLYDFSAHTKEDLSIPLPHVGKEGLAGMGIFTNGYLVSEHDTASTVLCNLLCGKARDLPIAAGSSVFSVTSEGTPEITFSDDAMKNIYLTPTFSARLLSGNQEDFALLCSNLEKGLSAQLTDLTKKGMDIFGIEKAARKARLNLTDFRQNLQNSACFTRTQINFINF